MVARLSIGIIEDNDDLRDSLVEVLANHGHRVVGFASAEDLTEAPAAEPFELMIVDLNLPGEDGVVLAARLKRVQPRLRVIMMTTRTALVDRVRGYDAGADLYLPKPMVEDELLAAVRALGRQILADVKAAAARPVLQLVTRARALRGPRGTLPLSAVDIALLTALARAPGHQLDHWQLLEASGLDLNERARANLSVRVTRLRVKLNQVGCAHDALRSVRTTGYQLCVPLEIA